MSNETSTGREGNASVPTLKPISESLKVLPHDFTGEAATHRIVERRVLTNENRSIYNHIIPFQAPFFTEGVTVRQVTTDTTLVEGHDYYLVGTFTKGIMNVNNYKPIAYSIVFDNPTITGEFEITYQTLGGDSTLDSARYAEIIANHMENPAEADWERIVGRPVLFPPAPHPLHMNDTTGWNSVENSVLQVAEELRLLREHEEAGHPGYGNVILELFRLNDRVNNFTSLLDNLKNELDNTTSGKLLALEKKVKEYDGIIKAGDTKVTNDLTLIIEANKVIAENDNRQLDTDLRAYVDSSVSTAKSTLESSISTVRQSVSTLETTLTNQIGNVRSQLNTTIEDGLINESKERTKALKTLSDTVANNKTTLENLINRRYNDNLSKINNLTNTVSDLSSTVNNNAEESRNAIQAINNRLPTDYVSIATLQTVTGDKTFTGTSHFRHTNGKGLTISNTGTVTNLTFNLGNSSKSISVNNQNVLKWGTSRILDENDLTSLTRSINEATTQISNTLVPRLDGIDDRLNGDEFVKRTGTTMTGPLHLKAANWFGNQNTTPAGFSGFYDWNSATLNGHRLPAMGLLVNKHNNTNNNGARGIGFDYGNSFATYTFAYSSTGEYLGKRQLLDNGHIVHTMGDSKTNVVSQYALKQLSENSLNIVNLTTTRPPNVGTITPNPYDSVQPPAITPNKLLFGNSNNGYLDGQVKQGVQFIGRVGNGINDAFKLSFSDGRMFFTTPEPHLGSQNWRIGKEVATKSDVVLQEGGTNNNIADYTSGNKNTYSSVTYVGQASSPGNKPGMLFTMASSQMNGYMFVSNEDKPAVWVAKRNVTGRINSNWFRVDGTDWADIRNMPGINLRTDSHMSVYTPNTNTSGRIDFLTNNTNHFGKIEYEHLHNRFVFMNGVGTNNSRNATYLVPQGNYASEILTSGSNPYVGIGSFTDQPNVGAPLLVDRTRSATPGPSIKETTTVSEYIPLVKTRLAIRGTNNVRTMSYGVYEHDQSTAFCLHSIGSQQDTDTNRYHIFYHSGEFESSAAGYRLYRTGNMVILQNKQGSISELRLLDDGTVHTKAGQVITRPDLNDVVFKNQNATISSQLKFTNSRPITFNENNRNQNVGVLRDNGTGVSISLGAGNPSENLNSLHGLHVHSTGTVIDTAGKLSVRFGNQSAVIKAQNGSVVYGTNRDTGAYLQLNVSDKDVYADVRNFYFGNVTGRSLGGLKVDDSGFVQLFNSVSNNMIGLSNTGSILKTNVTTFSFTRGGTIEVNEGVTIQETTGNYNVKLRSSGYLDVNTAHGLRINGLDDARIWRSSQGGYNVVTVNRISAEDYHRRSDKRLKDNIQKIDDALSKVNNIEVYTYNLKDSDKTSAGVIAQEIEKVLPDVVVKDDETGLMSVNYNDLIAYLIGSVKQLTDIVKVQDLKINEMDKKLKSLGVV